MTRRDVAPPSGLPAPRTAAGADGGEVDLVGLAEEIADRHLRAFPDERERYGPVGREWCVHDNQHLLNWAFADAHTGFVDLGEQVDWLARVLAGRGYPLERLAADLVTGATVVEERLGDSAVADRLRAAAERVTLRPEIGPG